MNTATAIRQFRDDLAQVRDSERSSWGSINSTADGFRFSVRQRCNTADCYESREYQVDMGRKTIAVVHERSDESSSSLQSYVVDIQLGEVQNYERQEWRS